MLIASLVEFAFPKPRMWQTHNAQLANFDMASFAYSGYRCIATGGFKVVSSRERPLIGPCDHSKINVFKSLRLISEIKIVFHLFGSRTSDL